ncbi:MAG: ribonuclease P protein component [bacterium]|nr:ribonuclease P protein component [bacterium]
MMSREHRLSSRTEFDRIWKRGRVVYGSFLALRFLENNVKTPRFGIVVSLKVSKRATKRNLLRRRIREALRTQFLPNIKNYDIVIMTKAEALTKSYKEIKEELERLLHRAKLFYDHA